MNTSAKYDEARAVLRKYWGYDDFRPGQWEIIEHVLESRDLLAILPTGGGKSICYQVPSLLLDGLTVVISPLIALMQDQVDGLTRRGIPAAFINSSLSTREVDQRWTDAEHGRYKLLYVAPERLATEMFLARADRLNVSLLAVDEAHCISEWGHNFRPAYLQIADARERIGEPPTIAVTATATPQVRSDIVTHLKLRTPRVLVRGFDRPNVVWSVFQTENKRNKVLDVLENVPGAGIVYSGTRKGVEHWARWLEDRAYTVASYHGGMPAAAREAMQDSWIAGERRIMVATNAFGMGIDKPDVRFVIHVDLPGTLEGYYQEAGRGGRDGKTSYAALLYHPSDDETPRTLIDESHPSTREMRAVYDAVCSLGQVAIGSGEDERIAVRLETVGRVTDLTPGKIRTAVDLIARQGSWSIVPQRAHYTPIRLLQPADYIRAYASGLSNEALSRFVVELLRTVHADAFTTWWDLDVRMLARRTQVGEERIPNAFEYLRKRDLLDWLPSEQTICVQLSHARSEKLPIEARTIKKSRRRAERRLEDMIRYARSSECRRHFLLTYFGESAPMRCGTCDVCLGRHEAFAPRPADEPIVHQILSNIRERAPRDDWFERRAAPSYRIDGLLNWLIQEGYVVQPQPLENRFELTEKGHRVLKVSQNDPS